jgi:hypothetical protein
MRISLRELLIVVAVAAVGMAGLKYASDNMLPVVQAMVGILTLTMCIRAVVDRGHARAFAIGFVICSSGYAIAAHVADDLYQSTTAANTCGLFQPTRLLLAISPENEQEQWVDATSRRLLRVDPTDFFDWPAASASNLHVPPINIRYIEGANIIISRGASLPLESWTELFQNKSLTNTDIVTASMYAQASGKRYAYVSVPWSLDFVRAGHCFGMLLVGYVGAHCAQLIYWRSRTAHISPATPT